MINMFRSHIIVLIFLLLSIHKLSAQDSRVDQGLARLESGEYNEALQAFNQALGLPSELSEENLPRAYYLRAMTRIYYYNAAVMKNDRQLVAELDDSYLQAYHDLMLAFEHDTKGTWLARINKELQSLYDGLVHHAILRLNQASDANKEQIQAAVLFGRALEYAETALEIKDGYLPQDIAGQAAYNLGMDRKGLDHFLEAIRLYRDKKPAEPDFLMGYVFYRAALIYRYQLNDPDSALRVVQNGLELMEAEYQRLSPGSEEERLKTEEAYNQVMADLTSFELDLYLNDLKQIDHASRRFREILSDNPGNYELRISYASLLEKIDMTAAIEQYKLAILIDSTRSIAYFNIGALYYSRAAELYRLAPEEEDPGKYGVLMESAKENFLNAVPWFEKVLESEPDNPEAVLALKNIALVFDNEELFRKYEEMEKDLQKK